MATTDPKWHDKAAEALENAIELMSPGALSFAVGEDGIALAVAPSLLEHEGQGDVYSFFDFDVSGFTDVFDEPPRIGWCTYPETALLFEGAIDGEDAVVHVFGQPFEDEQPVGVVDEEGNMRDIPPDTD